MQFLDSKRIIAFCSLIAVVLLVVAFYTAPVRAEPGSAPPVQSLPTRKKPPATKKPSKPDKPAGLDRGPALSSPERTVRLELKVWPLDP